MKRGDPGQTADSCDGSERIESRTDCGSTPHPTLSPGQPCVLRQEFTLAGQR